MCRDIQNKTESVVYIVEVQCGENNYFEKRQEQEKKNNECKNKPSSRTEWEIIRGKQLKCALI